MKVESSPKEQNSRCNHNPDEQVINTDTLHEKTTPESEQSQLELINQWQLNLKSLLEDLGISNCDSVIADELKGIMPDIVEKLDYLKKTDDLLKQSDDFTLSEVGFEKYKDAHLTVINFMTEAFLQKKVKEKDLKKVKFYFFSRAKHIQQQAETIPWLFSFIHFILLFIAAAALLAGGVLTAVLTQKNGIVLVLLFVSFSAFIRIANKIRKKYQKTALTPVRFTLSLLSICSLTTVLYASLFIVIPAFFTWENKPFWRDDALIIGLAVFTFVIWNHTLKHSEEAINLAKVDNEKKVIEDTVKVAQSEVTKQCSN
jgi:hypothetical protein